MVNKFLNSVNQGENNWKSYVATMIFGYVSFVILKLILVYFKPVLEPIQIASFPLYQLLTTVHIIGLILLLISVIVFHKRSPISLINTNKEMDSEGNNISWYNRIRWGKFFKGFIIWSIIMIICLIISILISGYAFTVSNFFNPDFLSLNNYVDIASLIVLILLAIPLQTAYEEILCRGYINQALSLKIKNPIFIIILSSLFFTSAHFLSPDYQTQLFSFIIAFILGIFFSLLTFMDNGLETAWGIHASNNIMIVFLNSAGGIWILFLLLFLPVFVIFKRKSIKESFK